MLGGADIQIDENGNYIACSGPPLRNPNLIKSYLLFFSNMFTDCTVMYRRSLVEENNIKYQEECYGIHDMKFYMDASKFGTIKGIDEILLKKRIYKEQVTQVQLRTNGDKRANAFARCQRESLKDSGFVLDDKCMNIINSIVTEVPKDHYSVEELNDLYRVFKEIMLQATELKVDYLKELKFALTKILVDRVMTRVDLFSDEFIMGGVCNG